MNSMYERLSTISFLSKNYTFKFLFIAFLGIHIPLIGLIVFVVFRPDNVNTFTVLTLTLLLTLGATALTLYIMNGLLFPLRTSRLALDEYIQKRKLPTLPVHYKDEAGILMRNIQLTVTELDNLLEEKKDLTGLLTHDLRAPLHNIKTVAEFLLDESDEAVAKQQINLLIQSAGDQIALLEHVLTLLREDHTLALDGNRLTLSPEKLVDEVIASFGPQTKQKNIRLEKNISFTGNITVQPELFKQVLKNLVGNAIKFSYQDSTVRVAVSHQQEKILIEVIDTGMGFETKVSEQLFDRFTKKGRKGTSGEASTGMGLYLSRRIINHHHGNLVAFSKGPEQGSTFTISLVK